MQTLSELRMRQTANRVSVCVSPASNSGRVWHGLATVVDSMSRYMPFVVTSCASKIHRLRASGPSQGRPRRAFRLSLTQLFQENRPFIFSGSRSSEAAGIANRPPRSL